jgi:hypothetical protein
MSNSIKLKKFHFIYKTTNLLNNKFYIGMHSTSNLKDGYLGSGKSLRYAIRKYGEKSFKIEIIEWCENREKLIQREKEIITEEYVNNVNCYNMKPGGAGGFNDQKHQFKCSQAAGLKHRERMLNDSEYREKLTKKTSESNARGHKNGIRKSIQHYYSWRGKKHNLETIEKIKLSKQGQGMGKKNSQFGSQWITNGEENKKIKSMEIIPSGWRLGRTNLKPL